jgi:hypothetical protein
MGILSIFFLYLALPSTTADVTTLEIDRCLVQKSLSAVEKRNGSYDRVSNLMKDRHHYAPVSVSSPIALGPVDELSSNLI